MATSEADIEGGGWISRAWTLGLVTLISVFIWALAESQTVQIAAISHEVVIAPGSEDTQIIRLDPATDAERRAAITATRLRMDLRLQGSPGALDAVRERIRGGVTLVAGDDFPIGPGELFAVNLQDALQRHEAFRNTAVTILDAQPDVFRVELNDLVTRPARLSIADAAGLLEGSPQVSPAELTVTLPSSVARDLPDGPIPAFVRLAPETLESLEPGQPTTLTGLRAELPPELAGAWGVRLENRPVSVEVTLRSRTDMLDLPPLPVQVVLAPSELDRFSIQIAPGDQDLQGVRLVGPVEQIERVRRALAEPTGGEMPMAALILDFEELERGITSKAAEILRLPRGVVAEIEDRLVRFQVRRRDQPPGDTAAPAGN